MVWTQTKKLLFTDFFDIENSGNMSLIERFAGDCPLPYQIRWNIKKSSDGYEILCECINMNVRMCWYECVNVNV